MHYWGYVYKRKWIRSAHPLPSSSFPLSFDKWLFGMVIQLLFFPTLAADDYAYSMNISIHDVCEIEALVAHAVTAFFD